MEKVFLKILQIRREKPLLKSIFNKVVAGTWPATLLKRESNISVFAKVLQKF